MVYRPLKCLKYLALASMASIVVRPVSAAPNGAPPRIEERVFIHWSPYDIQFPNDPTLWNRLARDVFQVSADSTFHVDADASVLRSGDLSRNVVPAPEKSFETVLTNAVAKLNGKTNTEVVLAIASHGADRCVLSPRGDISFHSITTVVGNVLGRARMPGTLSILYGACASGSLQRELRELSEKVPGLKVNLIYSAEAGEPTKKHLQDILANAARTITEGGSKIDKHSPVAGLMEKAPIVQAFGVSMKTGSGLWSNYQTRDTTSLSEIAKASERLSEDPGLTHLQGWMRANGERVRTSMTLMLASQSPRERIFAAENIGEVIHGDKSAIESLEKLLSQTTDPDEQFRIVTGLVKLDPQNSKFAEELVRRIRETRMLPTALGKAAYVTLDRVGQNSMLHALLDDPREQLWVKDQLLESSRKFKDVTDQWILSSLRLALEGKHPQIAPHFVELLSKPGLVVSPDLQNRIVAASISHPKLGIELFEALALGKLEWPAAATEKFFNYAISPEAPPAFRSLMLKYGSPCAWSFQSFAPR